jgi:AmiR/NasT family two-component response regulator
MSTAQARRDFHIVYYLNGRKRIQTRNFNADTGYDMMRKIARAMAPGLMAMAVHPLDEKTLIPELHKIGGDGRYIRSPSCL